MHACTRTCAHTHLEGGAVVAQRIAVAPGLVQLQALKITLLIALQKRAAASSRQSTVGSK